jgi:hypothetical protein
MKRTALVAWLLGSLGAMPLSAQEMTTGWLTRSPDQQPRPVSAAALPAAALPAQQVVPAPDDGSANQEQPWQTAWGVVGLRAIPAGAKVAPNGVRYHPNFSLDLTFDFWLWRSQGLYAFADMRLWGQRGEDGVTNARDGFLGTSKRQFDLTGGAAWNYSGPWELRAFGYTQNNLNRGTDVVAPSGFTDGFGLENRYYLSSEYGKLGQTGFDVARATFVSIGYLPSKDMIGNDNQTFHPGLTLRAYLICDLWDWPCYLYGDVTYIGEQSFRPRLLLFDGGIAVRPFQACTQWEFRLGSENTADLQLHNNLSLFYVSFRYVY